MTSVISVNGQLLAPNTPALSPLDRGFTLGDGLFETMKLERGVAWYQRRHLARLEEGARRIGLPYPQALPAWIDEVVHRPEVSDATGLALRITISRGVALMYGLNSAHEAPATTVITASPAPSFAPSVYDAGLSAHVASAPRNERAFTAGLKSTSYAEPILALREARAIGCDDALFLDTRGFVAEASTSNIFAWMHGVLITPPLECGILPGITRAVILELAAEHQIPVEPRAFMLRELLRADEAFCTSSLRGIAPLVRLDGYSIGTGAPGAQTRHIMTLYATQTTRV